MLKHRSSNRLNNKNSLDLRKKCMIRETYLVAESVDFKPNLLTTVHQRRQTYQMEYDQASNLHLNRKKKKKKNSKYKPIRQRNGWGRNPPSLYILTPSERKDTIIFPSDIFSYLSLQIISFSCCNKRLTRAIWLQTISIQTN